MECLQRRLIRYESEQLNAQIRISCPYFLLSESSMLYFNTAFSAKHFTSKTFYSLLSTLSSHQQNAALVNSQYLEYNS